MFIQYDNCSNNLHWNTTEEVFKETIPIFIKAVVFQNVGLSWLIKPKEKIDFMLMKCVLIGAKMGLSIIKQYVAVSMDLILDIFCDSMTGKVCTDVWP